MDHNDYPQMQHAADCADPGTADADPGTADAETIVISDRGHELMRPEPSVELPRLSPTERLQGESLKHVIESYLRYYAAGEGHTARAKQYDLQYFLQFLAGARQPEAVTVADWTLQATKDFVDARLAAGEAPATVSRRLATIKHFGRTVAERVHGFINPAREVKNPVLHPNRPQGLSSEEIELLREAGRAELSRRKSSFLALRDRFLLELLLSTGLRADEVRLLLCSQLSNDLRWLRNVKTKGRKFRNVYLDGDIRELFQQYLASREAELEKRFSDYTALPSKERQRFPVLVSVHGAVLSSPASFGLAPKTIWRIIAAFGRKAQENAGSTLGNLHPHKLRHTFAHGLLDTSKDVRLVAQALGHSDVRTTMRYTERTDEQVAEAIEQKLRQARRKQSGTG